MKTVREIRKMLFDSDKDCVINGIHMTNKEGRDYLYAIEDQDSLYAVTEVEKLVINN